MKTVSIELLSPAKNLEVGVAAINHGTDAVYIGGPSFGAREKAGNSIDDIEQLCRHAHQFDAKVYVTLNTLLYEREWEPARQLAWDCWNAGVDALIVQDLNLLHLDLPPIPLHASTQCDNLTVERVKELEQLGFEQVVLGRELSLEEIREIRRQTTVPLEFFVHGSLCVSHSGQCYLSQYIGTRSANRGACAQPCRLPWDLLTVARDAADQQLSLRAEQSGARQSSYRTLIQGKHLLCLKDLNNSAHLEELMDAGVTSFKIEGRLKEADYVKNVTAYYRQQLDAIFERRPEYIQASAGHCSYAFEVNPEKSFNRGFTDYFIHGRQPGIGSPFTPKSMGEYLGEVRWCNSVQMELATDKTLHNGDGLCFLDGNDTLVGIRADVVRAPGAPNQPWRISTNKPHGASRGSKIYRNYDIEWQRQVEASTGNRKIDIDLVLTETEDGYVLSVNRTVNDNNSSLLTPHPSLSTPKIVATNPTKALENIRKKLSQWGDTIYNPINIDINLSQPYLIPASVLGEMKRNLLQQLAVAEGGRVDRSLRHLAVSPEGRYAVPQGPVHLDRPTPVPTPVPTLDPDAIPAHLMSCHHCIRYANGMCPKETGQPTGPLFIRNGDHIFPLEFDCKNCIMYVNTPD